MERAKISQTRWPVELYEWMRERAHERRQSINRTVVELAERVREEAGPAHVQNILGRDLSCRMMPQGWEDQALQARQNRLGVPLRSDGLDVLGEPLPRDILEQAPRGPARLGVEPLSECQPGLVPLHPGHLERDLRVHAEGKGVLLASPGIAHPPVLAAVGHDREIEPPPSERGLLRGSGTIGFNDWRRTEDSYKIQKSSVHQ